MSKKFLSLSFLLWIFCLLSDCSELRRIWRILWRIKLYLKCSDVTSFWKSWDVFCTHEIIILIVKSTGIKVSCSKSLLNISWIFSQDILVMFMYWTFWIYSDSIKNYLHKANNVCRNHVVNGVAKKKKKRRINSNPFPKSTENISLFINKSSLHIFLQHNILLLLFLCYFFLTNVYMYWYFPALWGMSRCNWHLSLLF